MKRDHQGVQHERNGRILKRNVEIHFCHFGKTTELKQAFTTQLLKLRKSSLLLVILSYFNLYVYINIIMYIYIYLSLHPESHNATVDSDSEELIDPIWPKHYKRGAYTLIHTLYIIIHTYIPSLYVESSSESPKKKYKPHRYEHTTCVPPISGTISSVFVTGNASYLDPAMGFGGTWVLELIYGVGVLDYSWGWYCYFVVLLTFEKKSLIKIVLNTCL